ncbi:MAG: hypothetical protein LAQ30_18540 [Acidobacteriia bacterium]|nr:hypothetical protein [Terriglobia bacterium]
MPVAITRGSLKSKVWPALLSLPLVAALASPSRAAELIPFKFGISAPVVYVVAAYDPTGAYDGASGPPPSGSSMGIYSKQPGQPAPVKLEPGKAQQIEVAFDDSNKMP